MSSLHRRILVFLTTTIFFTSLLFPSTTFAVVVINEILPNPKGTDTNFEWVELYNDTNEETTLDGYVLEDKNGNRVVLSGTITDWHIVYPDKEESLSGNFALTNSGSEIKLFTASTSADPIDTFSYTGSSEDKSWGRIADGESIYGEKLTPTLGSRNQLPPTPTPKPTAEPRPDLPAGEAGDDQSLAETPSPTAKPEETARTQQSHPPVVLGKNNTTMQKGTGRNILAIRTALMDDSKKRGPENAETVLGISKNYRNPAGFLFAIAGVVFAITAAATAHIIRRRV